MGNFFHFYEMHLFSIYLVHIFFTLIVSVLAALSLGSRFDANDINIIAQDEARTKKIEDKNAFRKFLFKASLHKNNRFTNFTFIFLFNLPIPFIGYILTLWIVWYINNVKYDKQQVNSSFLNLDEFETSFLKVERIFGEGSLTELINSSYAPKSKKLKALSSLAANISPANLKIIRQTLTSSDDEIRMFGYAIINKAEKALNSKINKQLALIKEEVNKTHKQNKKKIAFAQKELAFLYWEMVYTELSHESLKESFLQESLKYLKASKSFFVEHITHIEEISLESETLLHSDYAVASSLYLLAGRIHMLSKEYNTALEELTLAQELLPNNNTFILPYLAEVYFITGKYSIVKTLLRDAKGLDLNATLHPIIEQWRVAS